MFCPEVHMIKMLTNSNYEVIEIAMLNHQKDLPRFFSYSIFLSGTTLAYWGCKLQESVNIFCSKNFWVLTFFLFLTQWKSVQSTALKLLLLGCACSFLEGFNLNVNLCAVRHCIKLSNYMVSDNNSMTINLKVWAFQL